jgi:CDP-glycerol glycerophosphotransferase
MRPPGRLPGVRRIPPLLRRVEPDVVLFDSWRGKYSDNPRAISEELRRRDPSLQHVWVLERDDPRVPDWVTPVRPNSVRHLESLGRARYVVANSSMPLYWRKKAGQRYLQTWHGTPLKKMAYDIARPQMDDAKRYYRHFARDIANWDLLISQNPFSTDVLPRAFRYDGPIVESGYPRNDALSSPAAPEAREHTRAQLGIPDGVRAVLYAPTWRDNKAFETPLDLGRMADALGPGTVLLLRAHNNVSRTVAEAPHPRVLDVSRVPDIREILLATDVLVTDYSSVMFDFSITRRPIVLFTYDIEYYRDELRGMYFEIEGEVPGPVVRTEADLVDALRDGGTPDPGGRQEYERFVARYCPADDGRAAARAVDAFLQT